MELATEVEPRNSWDSRRQHLRRLSTWDPCLPGEGGGNQPHRCLGSHCDIRVAFHGFPRRPTASLATRFHLRYKDTELQRMRPVSRVEQIGGFSGPEQRKLSEVR